MQLLLGHTIECRQRLPEDGTRSEEQEQHEAVARRHADWQRQAEGMNKSSRMHQRDILGQVTSSFSH